MRIYDSNGNLQYSDILGELNLGKYIRNITIDNSSNANNLTDYQVLITLDTATLISAGKMRSDCGDIRFYDRTNNLNYWIEGGINTTSTKIWVKIPSIPASSTKVIQMYYGNPNLTSVSNGDNTFLFFDDFSGSSLDANKWILTRLYGSGTYTATVANGYVEIYGASSTTAAIVSKFGTSLPFAIEGSYKAMSYTNKSVYHNITQNSVGDDNNKLAIARGADVFYYYKVVSGTVTYYQQSSVTTPTTWTRFSWKITTTNAYYFESGSQMNTTTTQDRFTTGTNYLMFSVYNSAATDYDWIALRNFAPTEPATTIGSEYSMPIRIR
jgi:hypothetical protein